MGAQQADIHMANSCHVLGPAVLCACGYDACLLQSQLSGLSWLHDAAVRCAALACISDRSTEPSAVTAANCAVSHQRLEQGCYSLSACMPSRYGGPGTDPCIMDLIRADLAT